MRALIIKKNANGIINLKDYEHFVLGEITDFGQITNELIKNGKSHFDFKCCILKNEDYIPFIMNIEDTIINQMQNFSFTRVKFKELSISDDEKELEIKKIILKNHLSDIEILEHKAIKLIVRKEFGNNVKNELSEIGSKINKLEKEMDNIDYKKYLEEFA